MLLRGADFVSGRSSPVSGSPRSTKVEKPRELALGVVPLALGLHQLVEGFVWLGLRRQDLAGATDFAIHLYLAFAWVVLPVLLPFALLCSRPIPADGRPWACASASASASSAYLAWALVNNDISARIDGNTVQYGGAGGYALARHCALCRRDVRSATALVTAGDRVVRHLQPRRGRARSRSCRPTA